MLKHLVSFALAVSTVSAFNGIHNDIAIVQGNISAIYADSYLAPFASQSLETPYELIDVHEDLIEKRGVITSIRKRADDCQKYHKISGADNCYTLSLLYNVEMKSILLWNPQVNSKCTNMYNGKNYCVLKENDYIFETTCVKTHLVTDSDTCSTVSNKYNIEKSDFYTMNPHVDNPACNNLLTGGNVCVKTETKVVLSKVARKSVVRTTTRARRTKSSRITRKAKTTTKKSISARPTKTVKKTTTKTTTKKPTTTRTTTTTTRTTTTTTRTTTTSAKATATKSVKLSVTSKKPNQRKLIQKNSALTYYWIAHPEDYKSGGKSVTVKTCNGESLGSVSEEYADALVMEGTGIVGNKVINLGGCTCSNYECFMEVDKKENPFGLTSFGTALRPYITIAANDIDRNTKIFVPSLEGWDIPGSSKKHNGCLLVEDRSWSFDGSHIDFYVYREKNYDTLNGKHKMNSVDIYEGGDCQLINYA